MNGILLPFRPVSTSIIGARSALLVMLFVNSLKPVASNVFLDEMKTSCAVLDQFHEVVVYYSIYIIH